MFLYIGMHRHFNPKRIGGTSGVILTVMIIGKLLGSMVYGPMGDYFGYEWPFIVSGILTILTIFIALKYFKVLNEKKSKVLS